MATTISGTSGVTFPAGGTGNTAGTVVGTTDTQMLTNKTIGAGTASVPPLFFTSGTNLTSAAAGAFEYDGDRFYGTTDTTGGQGYIPTTQIYRMTSSSGSITSGTNFFVLSGNSAASLVANAWYEVDATFYFTKNTAGTVQIQMSFSSAMTANQAGGTCIFLPAAGGTATGTASIASSQPLSVSGTSMSFSASPSITAGVNYTINLKAHFQAGSSASNVRFLQTCSAGTVSPMQGSYYKITRLPASNTGNFVA
jgi:hypothetical protein